MTQRKPIKHHAGVTNNWRIFLILRLWRAVERARVLFCYIIAFGIATVSSARRPTVSFDDVL